MNQPMKLGELLLRAKVINDLQLSTALAEQQKWGGKLGTILVRMGAISEDLLVKALSKQLGIPQAQLSHVEVPQQLLANITKELCVQHGVVPARYDHGQNLLYVAISDPYNVIAVDDIGRRTGLRVQPLVAGETEINAAIDNLFGGGAVGLGSAEAGMALTNNQGAQRQAVRAPMTAQPSVPPQPPVGAPPAWGGSPAPTYPGTGAGFTMPTGAYPAPTFAGGASPFANPSTFAGAQTGNFTAPVTAASFGAPAPGVPPAAGPNPQLDALLQLADKQARAVQAIVELLVEKRLLTREEYLSWVSQK